MYKLCSRAAERTGWLESGASARNLLVADLAGQLKCPLLVQGAHNRSDPKGQLPQKKATYYRWMGEFWVWGGVQ